MPCADERRALSALPFNVTVLSALCLAAAAVLLQCAPVRAEGEIVDGVAAPLDLEGGGGMPASNPRVAGILAAHPNQFVVICVAGCDGGKPKAVQVLPKPVVTRQGQVVPSSADMAKSAYGPPVPSRLKAKETNDVVCLAGCTGRTGQVLQRFADLPPVKRRAPEKPIEEPAKPDTPKKADDSIWDDLIP